MDVSLCLKYHRKGIDVDVDVDVVVMFHFWIHLQFCELYKDSHMIYICILSIHWIFGK